MTNKDIISEALASTSPQSLPVKNKNEDFSLEESLADQMSKVSTLATTSLQSLYLPLLPPCFTHQELPLLLGRQRKVLS